MKFKMLLAGSLTAIATMAVLASSINAKEAQRVDLATSPSVADKVQNINESWEKYFPRQYSSWRKTKDADDIVDMLEKKPQLAILWAGYGFAKDYNAPRGHYYAVQDNINTLRTGAPTDEKTGPMPTACWTCKSPDVPRLMERDGELNYFSGKWAKYGSEVENSIGCADCHDNKSGMLKMRRAYLDRGLKAAGLPTFAESSHQEKRSLVCAQCHVEYYFKPTDNGDKKAAVVTLPWAKGLSAEQMEAYYNEQPGKDGKQGFMDWKNKISGARMLKAQHPGYEIARTGIHYQKGVSCADCHMPYTQEGSMKYSDHQVGNPLESMDRSCMQCHRESEEKIKNIVKTKFERKEMLMEIAMDNLAKAHLETGKAMELGASDEELKSIRDDIRSAQWRWDYSIASHGSFFHAPEETLRLLGAANETAMQARLKLVKVLAKYGNAEFIAPDFSDKTKAQALAGVPLEKLIEAKKNFKATLEKAWHEEAIKKGVTLKKSREGLDSAKASFQY